jgi:hypothetical protein
MAQARTSETVQVATDNVIAYVRSRKADGWRLDSKGKPQWDYTFKDNRVPLTFSKEA